MLPNFLRLRETSRGSLGSMETSKGISVLVLRPRDDLLGMHGESTVRGGVVEGTRTRTSLPISGRGRDTRTIKSVAVF